MTSPRKKTKPRPRIVAKRKKDAQIAGAVDEVLERIVAGEVVGETGKNAAAVARKILERGDVRRIDLHTARGVFQIEAPRDGETDEQTKARVENRRTAERLFAESFVHDLNGPKTEPAPLDFEKLSPYGLPSPFAASPGDLPFAGGGVRGAGLGTRVDTANFALVIELRLDNFTHAEAARLLGDYLAAINESSIAGREPFVQSARLFQRELSSLAARRFE